MGVNNFSHFYIIIVFVYMYTVSQKNCANLFFAPSLSNMNRFQQKLEGVSRNKPLTKLCLKCPLHLKHVPALPWEIWSARLSRQRNNEGHIWMTNWIATNITGSYCLLSLKKSHMSHHIIFITACAQIVRLQHERKCIDAGAISQEHIQ